MKPLPPALDWPHLSAAASGAMPFAFIGQVQEMVGLAMVSRGPQCALGSVCCLELPEPHAPVLAEVVGFRQGRVLLMPYGETRGIGPRVRVVRTGERALAPVGEALLGRIIDGLVQPLEGKGPPRVPQQYPLYAPPLNPCAREAIAQPLDVGIRAINGLMTVGKGQRLGIF